jgi:hypothetical protein
MFVDGCSGEIEHSGRPRDVAGCRVEGHTDFAASGFTELMSPACGTDIDAGGWISNKIE